MNLFRFEHNNVICFSAFSKYKHGHIKKIQTAFFKN